MSTELFSLDELVNIEGLERKTNPASNKINLTLGVINSKELNKLISFIKALKLKVKIDVVKETLVSTNLSKIDTALDVIDSTVYSTLANPEFIRQFFFNETKMEHLDKLMDELDFLEEQAHMNQANLDDLSDEEKAFLNEKNKLVITNEDLLKDIVIVPEEETKTDEDTDLMINLDSDIQEEESDGADITILEEPKMLTICYIKYDSMQTYVEATTSPEIEDYYIQLKNIISSL